jgi:hypothetical protein
VRLTPQDIANAFEVSGLTPIRKAFSKFNDKGCAMQAYAEAHEQYNGSPANVSLDIGKAYFEGFTTGWDGNPPLPDKRIVAHYGVEGAMRYHDGIQDGNAAASQVFAPTANELTYTH